MRCKIFAGIAMLALVIQMAVVGEAVQEVFEYIPGKDLVNPAEYYQGESI